MSWIRLSTLLASVVALTLFTTEASAHMERKSLSSRASHSKITHKRQLDPFYTSNYTGEATYFEGGAGALACGDVRDSPDTQLFAALCFVQFDAAPGATLTNANRNPVCGPFSPSEKHTSGNWITAAPDQDESAYVVVGGDGLLNCVGTAAVACHTPRTVSVTYNGVTVSGIQVVDRMQRANCVSGDLDLSDDAFLGLAGSLALGVLPVITWVFEN